MKILSKIRLFVIFIILSMLFSCERGGNEQKLQEASNTEDDVKQPTYQKTGSIERLNDKINDLISDNAKIEILASGFTWSEGPLWLESENKLIFTDVPENKIYQWSPGDTEASVYLTPSGYTGESEHGGESGANGLILDTENNLVLCQHGDRQLAKMTAPISSPAAEFEAIVTNWEGKKFNSPNDLVLGSKGIYYFTDPPYGLPKPNREGDKEIDFQGVYSVRDGIATLEYKDLERPNGVALSPDETKLYVANSHGKRPIWMVFDVDEAGHLSNGKVFFDALALSKTAKGMPDGLKVDNAGNLFATGPGGVLVFSPEGEHLGTIKTGQATANCAFNADKSILYMTADMHLMRLVLKPKA
ncbi:MAG: SMP-30/gluconolactonase/LRE family protein [Bacteroidota bacterium]